MVVEVWQNDQTSEIYLMFRLAHEPPATLQEVVDKYGISHETRQHQNIGLVHTAKAPTMAELLETEKCR
jgi:hypothetical protein